MESQMSIQNMPTWLVACRNKGAAFPRSPFSLDTIVSLHSNGWLLYGFSIFPRH